MSDHVPGLLRKGTTDCGVWSCSSGAREYGVQMERNLLFGVPGERREDYILQTMLFGRISHLPPSQAYGPIRLDRFSAYHSNPADFRITGVRAMAPYCYLYDAPDDELDRIAYYFDFEPPDDRDPVTTALPALVAIDRRRQSQQGGGGLWEITGPDGSITVLDERPGRARRSSTIREWKAAVCMACDRSRTRAELDQLNEMAGIPPRSPPS